MQGEHPANVIRQIPDGSWISADSHWLWRGGRWVPLPAAAWPPALFWFTSAPSWFATLLVVGLIAVIPVVGTMNLYGYAIVTSRNLRAGYRVLPPANFSFIEAGAPAALLGIAWSLATFLAFLAAGGAVGAVTYQWRHDWVWTFALGFAGAATVATAVLTVYRVLLVPALELSGREGWAIFRLGRLVRHGREHWRATWYGTGVLILWALGYAAASLVAAFVPFGSIFAAIVGVPVMAAMLAVVLARFDDPPAGFTLGWANALAAAVVGLSLLAIGLVWATSLAFASYIGGHHEEVTCLFAPGCSATYSGDLETITHVQRDPQDPALVVVQVEYINHSRSAASIDPGEYKVKTVAGELLAPSSDCLAPGSASVPLGGRLEQRACFRLPDAQADFEVRVPWTGWTSQTGRVPCPSPPISSRPSPC